jgi:hypothetical protein
VETRHLTYAELGEALGISAASAKRLAIRRGWPKQPGNDGKARVSVPAERLQVERKATSDEASEAAGDATGVVTSAVTGDITSVMEALSRHVQRLEWALEKAEAERDKAQGERDCERAHASTLAAEAATAGALRTTVEALKAALDAEKVRLAEIRQDRDRLVTLATARRSWLPWWRVG